MDLTVTIGWWLVPLALTIAAWFPTVRYQPSAGGYLPDITPLFYAGGSLIATLVVWLIYFIIV